MAFFVKDSELRKLQSEAERGREIKKVEKQYRKEIEKIHLEHEEELEDLRDGLNRKIHVLERDASKSDTAKKDAVKDALDEHKNKVEDLKREHAAAIDKISDEKKELEGKISVLNERVSTSADLTKRELNVEDSEDELERTAKFLAEREKEFEKKVKAFDARVKDENEAQYKAGFTDGVSKTLLEGDKKAEKANDNVYKLADKALGRETTVITTTAPQVQKQGK